MYRLKNPPKIQIKLFSFLISIVIYRFMFWASLRGRRNFFLNYYFIINSTVAVLEQFLKFIWKPNIFTSSLEILIYWIEHEMNNKGGDSDCDYIFYVWCLRTRSFSPCWSVVRNPTIVIDFKKYINFLTTYAFLYLVKYASHVVP